MRGGHCETLSLAGPVEKIRSSYSETNGAVTSIWYYTGDRAETFGTLLNSYQTWEFTAANYLVGLHGRMVGTKITQLGFVTLDTEMEACPYFWD